MPSRRHFLLIPVGSSGDVNPFVGLGAALSARGHRVTVMTNAYFRSLIERQGLEFVEFGTAQEFLNTVNHPDLWHPQRSFKLIFEDTVLPKLKPMYDAIMAQVIPGETVVIGSLLAIAARIGQEKGKYPFASLHLQPSVFRSVGDPPVLPGFPDVKGWPPWFIRGFYRLADVFIDAKIAGPINAFRATLGLAPVHRIIDLWWHSPQCVIGFFPDWFSAPQQEWPANTQLVGFPLYDGASVETVPPELDAFLTSGPAPIVFTPGSANNQGAGFFRASVKICQTLGSRGILLTKFPEQLPQNLPPTIRPFGYVPFSRILPRASALVHHGGIGTTAQALAAGIPQLVMPLAHDQPDNASRVVRLGTGLKIPPHAYPKKGEQLLRKLLTETYFRANAQKVQSRFASERPMAHACEVLERL